MSRIKVVNPNESWMGTEYYIDGKKINNVRSVDFRGDIGFRFAPETVKQAVVVLRKELISNRDLRDAFLKSMLSALDDDFWNSRETVGDQLDIGYDDFNEAAALMLNRLIGIEE